MDELPDYSAAIAYLRSADDRMATVIDAVGPCDLRPGGHRFSALADAIVSQQISVQAAAAIWRRLESALGSVEPATIFAADDPTLRGAGLSSQKVRYLRDLAAHFAAGALDDLPQLPDEAAIVRLTAICGIGRWTAEIYLLFGLGRLDMLPADDLGLRYAVQRLCELEAPPPAREVRRIGQIWQPYRSIAAWYLWRWRRI
ncbi:MAG: DNA-3-methyladenine glycosylase 2 family protein [Oscillochloris sp.]|nr:DNA-3-methyladenine glycosylase 2 family protein [Oscillochloris sp.]